MQIRVREGTAEGYRVGELYGLLDAQGMNHYFVVEGVVDHSTLEGREVTAKERLDPGAGS